MKRKGLRVVEMMRLMTSIERYMSYSTLHPHMRVMIVRSRRVILVVMVLVVVMVILMMIMMVVVVVAATMVLEEVPDLLVV